MLASKIKREVFVFIREETGTYTGGNNSLLKVFKKVVPEQDKQSLSTELRL